MRKISSIFSIIVVSVVLMGCEVPAPGTPLPTVTPGPTKTPLPTMTPEPTWTPTPLPTATEAAPSPTDTPVLPTPSETPIPPTSTDTPVVVTVERTPTPTRTPSGLWPPRPEAFVSYVEDILAYLNASPLHIVRLRAMLHDWRAISERLGAVEEADLDHDGLLEWIIVIADPLSQTLSVPGDLLVVDREDTVFVMRYQASAQLAEAPENVAILAAKDINADGKVELAYTTTSCGAHTCITAVHIVAWDGEAFVSLSPGKIEMENPLSPARLENRDDDPALELVLYGGVISSVGAGPQRARTDIYKWTGMDYVPVETVYDESDLLYFKVLDANMALMAGDYSQALALYQEVLVSSSLRVWKGVQERDDLGAFSRFRLVLTYVLVHDESRAQAILEEMQSTQPEHIYNQLAQVFWDYYTKQGGVTAACQAVAEFAQEHLQAVEILNGYGYANPTFTASDICPIGMGTVGP